MESILTSIKKMLGIAEDYEHFDSDLIMHINTVFLTLSQLGIGSSKSFMIEDKSATWNDFISDNDNLEAVKTYIYLRVRLIFDPPLSSVVIECMNREIKELEFRLNIEAESGESE